jgi:hypothetical protein
VPDPQESIHSSGVDDSETMGSVANWREIAILLIDPYFGEQTAQAGENACFRQPFKKPSSRFAGGVYLDMRWTN